MWLNLVSPAEPGNHDREVMTHRDEPREDESSGLADMFL
jgi:hypothetical protein